MSKREKAARRREAELVLINEVLRLDVDYRDRHGPDFEAITLPRELWERLVSNAMKASL